MIVDVARGRRFAVRALPLAVLYSSALTIACLVSYLLITRALEAAYLGPIPVGRERVGRRGLS
jgi:hypothetical protein